MAAENILGLITHVERRGKARFWPNRAAPSAGTDLYLLFYPLWPPVRRLLAMGWRGVRRAVSRRRQP